MLRFYGDLGGGRIDTGLVKGVYHYRGVYIYLFIFIFIFFWHEINAEF